MHSGGLITYIRTDSIEIDGGKVPSIRNKVVELYGEEYLESRNFKNKKEAKNIQEAHGAITPVDIGVLPDETKKILNNDEQKIYSLVWERTIASQMKDALFERTSVEFVPRKEEGLATFLFSDQQLVFPGYLKATNEEVTNNPPPNIKEEDLVDLKTIIKDQHFTDPPPRYNDASMIKTLEEKETGSAGIFTTLMKGLLECGPACRHAIKTFMSVVNIPALPVSR